MTLDVNKEEMTIMGVQFENFRIFKSVWYAVSSSMIEGFTPTVQDVLELKIYSEQKFEEAKYA